MKPYLPALTLVGLLAWALTGYAMTGGQRDDQPVSADRLDVEFLGVRWWTQERDVDVAAVGRPEPAQFCDKFLEALSEQGLAAREAQLLDAVGDHEIGRAHV